MQEWLAASRSRRLPIRSDHELQQAVLLALEHVQQAISEQEQPEASVFWDRAGRPKAQGLTPRDEEFVTDHLVRMLRRELCPRGISVTREAEVARGNETDIRIEAPPNAEEGLADAAVVIVEVKCVWNRDVPDSLIAQLAERYLARAGRKHGIYLVADFSMDRWSQTLPSGEPDRRLAAARRAVDKLPELLAAGTEKARRAGFEIVTRVQSIPAGW
jgi:hypothetical protein